MQTSSLVDYNQAYASYNATVLAPAAEPDMSKVFHPKCKVMVGEVESVPGRATIILL